MTAQSSVQLLHTLIFFAVGGGLYALYFCLHLLPLKNRKIFNIILIAFGVLCVLIVFGVTLATNSGIARWYMIASTIFGSFVAHEIATKLIKHKLIAKKQKK